MSGSVSSLGSSQISSEIATVEARLEKPITVLQNQAETDKADITAWGAIQGAVSTLSGSLSGIQDVSSINVRSASTTVPSVATATASNTALAGQYDLTNIALAKTQEIYSSLQSSAAATVGSGALTFTLKNGKTETVTVGSGSATLNGIAQAINKVAGGVQASVVGTSGGARLVLQGSATGSSQAFSVSGTGALAKFDYASGTGTAGSWTRAQSASNASFKINGVPVSTASNSVSSAVSGVAISLVGSGSTELTVGSAPGAIANVVATVATNLNAAVAAIAKQTAYVPPTSSASASASAAKSGALLGNFTASDISSQLLSAVTSAVSSGVSSNAIGLTVGSTGAVSFNGATFATAYAANPTGVTALVAQIYKNLSTVSTNALGSASTSTSSTSSATVNTTGDGANKGSIAAQVLSLQNNITTLNSSATAISKSNAAQLKILEAEYTATEAAQTAAETTQAYLDIFTSTSSSASTTG